MTHCLFTKKCTNSHFLFEKLLIVIFYLKVPNYNIFNEKLKQNFFLYEKIQIAPFLNKKSYKMLPFHTKNLQILIYKIYETLH